MIETLHKWVEKRQRLASGLLAALCFGFLEVAGLIEVLRRGTSDAPALLRALLSGLLILAVVAASGSVIAALDRFVKRQRAQLATPAPDPALDPVLGMPLEADRLARDLDPSEGSGLHLERTPVTTAAGSSGTNDPNTQRLESQLRQLTLLHEVTRSLTMTLEFDELLRRLTELLCKERRFDSFAILLPDEEETGLVVRNTFGFDPHLDPTGLRLPLSDETSNKAMHSQGQVTSRALSTLERSRLEGLGWHPDEAELLSIPMRHKDRVEGILVFARRAEAPFTAEEIQLLRNIAGQAALGLSNARLFAQTVKLSLTDPLTGLHNRRHFFAKLDLEIMRARRYGSPVSVAMFDIDHFKNLNDTHGHAAGDVVLQEIASLLAQNVRRNDIAARFGGEEFCVILPAVAKEEAGQAAEKLRRLVAETPFPGEASQPGGKLTVSVGYATLPGDAEDVDSLLDAADTALYASKRAGRNRSTPYQPGLRQVDPVRRTTRSAERRAETGGNNGSNPRFPKRLEPQSLEAQFTAPPIETRGIKAGH